MKKNKKFKLILIIIFILLVFLIGGFIIYNNINKKQVKEFSVKYMVDGEIYKEEIVKYKDTLELEDLNKNGYTFLGWYEGKRKFDNNIEITKNTVLEAKFQEFPLYVLFDDNNGNKTKVPVDYNSTVDEIITPTKSGYTFLGWYLNDKKYDFKIKVTKNITLIAKWQKKLEKQEINVNNYINTYINNSIVFNTKFNQDNHNISVNIKGVNNKLSKIIDSIVENTNTIVNRSDINNIIVNYNDTNYNLAKTKNIRNEIERLFNDLTNTSSMDFKNRTLSSLYNKNISVEFVLNDKYYYSKDENIKYQISFTSDNIVSKKYMDNNSISSVNQIKLYSVHFNSSNHYINCYYDSSYSNKSVATIIYDHSHSGGGNGTGLNDALRTFASNPNLANLVIHLPDGNTRKMSRGQILSLQNNGTSLISFGNTIIKAMGISGSVSTVNHNKFANKKLKLSIELLGNKAFEDGFLNEYYVVIGS